MGFNTDLLKFWFSIDIKACSLHVTWHVFFSIWCSHQSTPSNSIRTPLSLPLLRSLPFRIPSSLVDPTHSSVSGGGGGGGVWNVSEPWELHRRGQSWRKTPNSVCLCPSKPPHHPPTVWRGRLSSNKSNESGLLVRAGEEVRSSKWFHIVPKKSLVGSMTLMRQLLISFILAVASFLENLNGYHLLRYPAMAGWKKKEKWKKLQPRSKLSRAGNKKPTRLENNKEQKNRVK